jgi:hypothetical protein
MIADGFRMAGDPSFGGLLLQVAASLAMARRSRGGN